MPRVSTGIVLAAAYADKLRKTMFAQLREHIRADKEFAGKVAYYVGALNRALFTLFTEELKVDKLDAVRIMIDYEVDEANKTIIWKWDTLRIEIYKRVPPESYEEILKKFISKAPELSVRAVKYSISKIAETFDGDLVYTIKIDEKEVGAAVIYKIDENVAALKIAAVIEPTPAIYERAKLELAGKLVEDVLGEHVSRLVQIGRHVGYDEALKIINAIRSKVEAAPLEKIPEIAEE